MIFIIEEHNVLCEVWNNLRILFRWT